MKGKLILIALFAVVCAKAQDDKEDVDIKVRNQAIQLTNKATECFAVNNNEEAVSYIRETIRIDSAYYNSYLQLLNAIVGDQSLATPGLLKLVSQGRRIFPKDSELCYLSGELQKKNKNYSKAIAEYALALKNSKNGGCDSTKLPYYHLSQGICYYHLSQYSSAINCFNEAIRLHPNLAPAYTNRGICLYRQSKKSEAVRDWKKAVSLGETQSEAYLRMYGR